jgi:predicted membrane channel-forming protein YqfA (hemolysin III family)
MLHPNFYGREWRTFRLLTFVATGLSGFAPIIHGIYKFGLNQMMVQSGLPYYLTEGAIFVLGAVFYGVSACDQTHFQVPARVGFHVFVDSHMTDEVP